MWMLIAIDAVLLVGLLYSLWRLHQLQAVLAIQQVAKPGADHQALKPAEPRRREPPPRPTPLDEFPSEAGLEDLAAPQRLRRPRPSPGSRSSQRLAPMGR